MLSSNEMNLVSFVCLKQRIDKKESLAAPITVLRTLTDLCWHGAGAYQIVAATPRQKFVSLILRRNISSTRAAAYCSSSSNMGSLATEEMPGVQPVEDAKNQRLTPPAARCQIGHRWRELQGAQNWKGLLKPQMDEDLRAEIVRYGELTEVTYDAFDFDKHSVYCGSCKWSKENLFKEAELLATGYTVTRYTRNIHLQVSLVYSRARVESLKERAFSLARGLLRVIVDANPLTLNLKS